jgi:hypothetical protein
LQVFWPRCQDVRGSSALVILGLMMLLGSLPCLAYSGLRFSEMMKVDDDIARYRKTLKDEEQDSSQFEMAEGGLSASIKIRREKMDDVSLFGPLGGGMIVVGAALALIGGRKKK